METGWQRQRAARCCRCRQIVRPMVLRGVAPRPASLLLGGLLADTAGTRAVCYLGGALLAARAGLILRRPGSGRNP